MQRSFAGRGRKHRRGVTLVELMVSVAIVGILAAIAIPVFSHYVKEADLNEAVANLQGILEAEQAYYARFQQYTAPLGYCPNQGSDPPERRTVLWPDSSGPSPTAIETDCGAGWAQLGWRPDEGVAFQYRVFSAFDDTGAYVNQPDLPGSFPGLVGSHQTFGVDWTNEFGAASMQPWCAVEARADYDGDNQFVYFRTNSYNQKAYRHPNPDVDGITTY